MLSLMTQLFAVFGNKTVLSLWFLATELCVALSDRIVLPLVLGYRTVMCIVLGDRTMCCC